jgi:3-deoxy-7-phosphoheptulonate synthase
VIIVMNPATPEDKIQAVATRLQGLGFKTIFNHGEVMTVIAAIGDKRLIETESIESMEGVKQILSIREPFKMAGREAHPQDTVIRFENGVSIGGDSDFVVMAGPCSIEEDRELLFRIAENVKKSGAQFLRGGAFKPRTSPYDFQGLEEEGLKQLAEASKRTGLLVVTEVMDSQEVPLVAEYSDILQIGTRNMQNFKLLKTVGKQNKPVMLKRGMASTVREFLLAAEHIMYQGNDNVILCERGVRGFDSTFTRNILDLAIVPVLKKLSHLPVVVDPSHATGHRYIVPPMCYATVLSGAHGLMTEVHYDPDKALSDGAQSLTIEQFDALMDNLRKVVACHKGLTQHECLTKA